VSFPRIVLAAMLLGGCGNARYVDSFVNVTAPKKARRGEPVTIRARAAVGDGCSSFVAFYATVDERDQSVAISGYTDRGSGLFPCGQEVTFPERTATFTPQGVGTYRVKFKLWPREVGYDYRRMEPPVAKGPYHAALDETLAIEVTE
jgi:hypothetical protein